MLANVQQRLISYSSRLLRENLQTLLVIGSYLIGKIQKCQNFCRLPTFSVKCLLRLENISRIEASKSF